MIFHSTDTAIMLGLDNIAIMARGVMDRTDAVRKALQLLATGSLIALHNLLEEFKSIDLKR